MTAADHEPICGPSCDPMICHAGHCALEQASDPDVRNDPPGPDQPAEHAHKPNEQAGEHVANGLRDKVRDTIHAANPTCTDYHAAECRPCTARARLVMRLAVQPELDRLRARLDYWQRRASAHARAAETAEQRLAELREEARDE